MSDEKKPSPPSQPRVQEVIIQKGYRPSPQSKEQGGYQGPTNTAPVTPPTGGTAVKPPMNSK